MSRLESLRGELRRRECSQGNSHDVAKMTRLRREIETLEVSKMSERLPRGGVPALKWEFDDQGEWSAPSELKDSDGDAMFQYRIQVCADGSFDITASDKELGLGDRKTADLFRSAVETCEFREWEIRDGH